MSVLKIWTTNKSLPFDQITVEKNAIYYDKETNRLLFGLGNNQWQIINAGGGGGTGDGYTGSKGYTGSQGYIGYAGSRGFTGSRGLLGYTGSRGLDGFVGRDGYTGSKGEIGYTGSQGRGLYVKDVVPTISDLPSINNQIGDAYIVEFDKHLYIWNGTTWLDVGGFSGFTGPRGYTGSQGFTGSR